MTKKRRWIFGLFVLVIGASFFVYVSNKKEEAPQFSSLQVERMDLVQSVSETGSVTSDLEIKYGWEMSGRVASTSFAVGDDVNGGDIIAQLAADQQVASVREAESRVAAAQARLNQTLAGVSEEERAQSAAAVAEAEAAVVQARVQLNQIGLSGENAIRKAEITLEEAKDDLENEGESTDQAVEDAYADAVRTLKTELQTGLDALAVMADIQHNYAPLTGSNQEALLLSAEKSQAVRKMVGAVNAGKWQADDILSYRQGARATVNSLVAGVSLEEDIEAAMSELSDALDSVGEALDQLSIALNEQPTPLAADKTSLSAEQVAVDTALTNLVNASQEIQSAKLAVKTGADSTRIAYERALQDLAHAERSFLQDVAEAEANLRIREAALQTAQAAYEAIIAPPREVDTASLRAEVARELASLVRAQDELAKTELRALSSGRVARLDIEIGETVTAGESVVTIISSQQHIEVDVSESDIAKVSIDDPVEITLDAFGPERVFDGRVRSIEPAETEISGVVYYKTDVVFEVEEAKDIKPGMTANIEILTERKADVLAIPSRAVLQEDGKKVVRILKNAQTGDFEKREVETGLKGNDGLIEVVSGLQPGEEVITFIQVEE